MAKRRLGTILLAGALLAAGLAWLVAFWGAWPRTSNTSPLMALFAGLCACTYIASAVLTWRRSPLAAPAFLAAIGLLLFPARYLVPGGGIFGPSWVVVILVGLIGYWYLRSAGPGFRGGGPGCEPKTSLPRRSAKGAKAGTRGSHHRQGMVEGTVA
jgi:hypothetical protein